MSSATLSTQLQTLTGTTSEATAISQFVAAWATYFAQSVCAVGGEGGGDDIAFTPNAAANNAMSTAMSGLSGTDAADDKVQAGIIAWWDALVAAPGTYYAGASSITKPTLTGIASAIATLFTSNKNSALSLSAASDAIAASLHTANSGGFTDLGFIV